MAMTQPAGSGQQAAETLGLPVRTVQGRIAEGRSYNDIQSDVERQANEAKQRLVLDCTEGVRRAARVILAGLESPQSRAEGLKPSELREIATVLGILADKLGIYTGKRSRSPSCSPPGRPTWTSGLPVIYPPHSRARVW